MLAASSAAQTARQFGVTHLFNSAEKPNVVQALRALTNGGADYSFECVGEFQGCNPNGFGCLCRTGGGGTSGFAVTSDALGLVRNINILDPRLFGIVIGKSF
jgi:Zn-dependent alcohol dehydrogenase